MSAELKLSKTLAALVLLGGVVAAGQAFAQATVVLNFANNPGVGYFDETPVAPVGGNPGTTLGEQRRIATQHAANIWGATLTSDAVIRIRAQFTAQTCTSTTAVLGSAGPLSNARNFPGATFENTWYPVALRNKLAGNEASPGADQLQINFNVNLGTPGCLDNSPWYLGIDNNLPTGAINLVVVLLHEFGHGLGFTVGPTNGQTGARSQSSPSIWERFMRDNQTGLSWFEMTSNAQRAATSIGLNRLVWDGPNVNAEVPNVLRFGIGGATISGQAAGALAGTVLRIGEASFGGAIGEPPLTGELMPVQEQTPGAGEGCEPFNAANSRAVQGKVALILRGVCPFTQKTKNAQDAGAIAVLIQDNVAEAGEQPSGLGGADPTVTIPAARIFLADGQNLQEALKRRSRTSSGVFVTLGLVVPQYAGADPQGRIKLFTPNPFQGGSSVSHYDTSATRNQLMEPSVNADLTQSVLPPEDLTFMLFKDIGW
jgi:hypothetical protein